MPAAATQTLFGQADCQLDTRMLSQLAQLCKPDLPASNASLVGDFAFSEICITDIEAEHYMDILTALRSEETSDYMVTVIGRLQEQGGAVAQLGEAVEAEYDRLCKVFFLRSRCIEVSRASTGEVVGRIVSFPDQVSDDYGNNLEPRHEKGMNPGKVASAEKAAERKGKTLFIGHGQGATMAQLCGCVHDEQCITFDATFASELLVQAFFRNEIPKPVKMDARQEGEREWNVISENLELVQKRFAGAVREALKIAKQAAEEQEAKKAEDADKKAKEDAAKPKEEQSAPAAKPKAQSQRPGRQPFADKKKEEKPAAKKEADPNANSAEDAQKYFEKRINNKVSGLVPEGPANRFQNNGKFPASALADLLSQYSTTVVSAPYPFAAPEEEKDEDDE